MGDSPAFGTAKRVAIANGLTEALIGISQKALEKDLIINVAKLKAHSQDISSQ